MPVASSAIEIIDKYGPTDQRTSDVIVFLDGLKWTTAYFYVLNEYPIVKSTLKRFSGISYTRGGTHINKYMMIVIGWDLNYISLNYNTSRE